MKSVGILSCLLTAFLFLSVWKGVPVSLRGQPQLKLDPGQQELVDSSKKAIITAGISESYFNSHFTLLKVFNQPSDRRVMWKFAINGYEAIINDSIGSTSVDFKQINIHSVSRSLGQLTEINTTISRPRALKTLKSCIGNYTEPYVELGQVKGRAQLFLVGTQKPTRHSREKDEAVEREREEAEERARSRGATDVIENEEGERSTAPVIIGYINLQTGKCTKGKGVVAREGL